MSPLHCVAPQKSRQPDRRLNGSGRFVSARLRMVARVLSSKALYSGAVNPKLAAWPTSAQNFEHEIQCCPPCPDDAPQWLCGEPRRGESTRTIVIALIANIVIAIAKLVGGLISGSRGMLAESADSAADSVNEIFLAVGLHRDRQPVDAAHPEGHGRERFLWAFMAAIASFLIGGCLSIATAISGLKTPHPVSGGLTTWIILAISFTADGASWAQSMRQARRQAGKYNLPVWRYVLRASDPVVRAVVFEDSAALIGLCIAASGLLLSTIVGSSLPDSVASLLIGILFSVTAFGLGRPFADFLVGRSLPSPQFEKLYSIVKDDAESNVQPARVSPIPASVSESSFAK